MRLYVKVVSTGSFSECARFFNLSASSVSRQMDSLEDELGVRLLQRTTRKVSLTESGRIYLDKANMILNEIDEAKRIVSQMQSKPRGLLKVGMPTSFGSLHLAPLLAKFIVQYPEVTLDLNLSDKNLDIVAEGLDVTIRVDPTEDSSLISRKIMHVTRVLCASPKYLQKTKAIKLPRDLKMHSCITYNYGQGSDTWYFRSSKGSLQSVKIAGPIIVNNSEVIKKCILDGMGIGLLSNWVIGSEIKSGSLVRILPSFRADLIPETETGIYALYPSSHHLSPKVRVFIDYISEELGKKPELV